MSKELSEMTLEELWELFPIFLVKPDPNWSIYYAQMEVELKQYTKDLGIKRISHVGSTSIKGIWAKNIVDVLIEVNKNEDINAIAKAIEPHDFILMSKEDNWIIFNRGYTNKGFAKKVYHIHIRYAGDNEELYFRDYLNEHSNVAKEYEELKLSLWKKYEHNRNGYTEAKHDFIRKYTDIAKEEYKGKYE